MGISFKGNNKMNAIVIAAIENHEFFVRPFSEECLSELNRLENDAKKVNGNTTVEEVNSSGTYKIHVKVNDGESLNFMESFFGMLYRKFASEANRVCIDKSTDERFYGAIISEAFIEPCERKLIA